MTSPVDVYRTPKASLERAGSVADDIERFPAISTWLVFLLSIVTMNIYMVWWMWSRSRVVNEGRSAARIGKGLVVTASVLFLIQIGVGIADGVTDRELYAVYPWLLVIDLCATIAYVVWAFSLRRALMEICGNSVRIGPVMTFFFSVIYLNYKVREAQLLSASVSESARDLQGAVAA